MNKHKQDEVAYFEQLEKSAYEELERKLASAKRQIKKNNAYYHRDIGELKEQLKRAKKESEWQTIETAPKESIKVLGAWCYGGVVDVVEIMTFYDSAWVDLEGYTVCPTHWMPLPQAPTKGER